MANKQGLDPDDPGKAMENFIIDNYVILTNRLEVEKVLPYLIQWRILSIDEKERIQNKETERVKVEELLGTLSRSGKCTPEQLINILQRTDQTTLVDNVKSVDRERWSLPYVERLTSLNVLPAKLQLEFVQKAKNKLLRKADKLFDHRTLKDKKRLKRAKRQFRDYKAIIESIIPEGCFILNLRFLQPCDVDDFYHDHFRVGPGSLSAALSDILITDEMRAVVGGEELMVRLEVRYDDYIRVRRCLCTTGLQRTASLDNLSAILPPSKKTNSRPLLNSLDLATARTQDSSFTHWVNNPYSRQLGHMVRKKTVVDARKVFERKHEIALNQMGLKEDMVRSLQKEVTRLTQEQETAQKLLLDNKKEIEELTGANKGMEDTIDELLAEKTKLTNKLAMKEDEEKLKGDKVDSLQREVTRLTQEKEAAQKELSDRRKEIQDLTGDKKDTMEDTIEEREKPPKLTMKKTAMKEHEEKLKGDKVERPQGEATRLTHQKEMASHGDGVWIFVDDSNIWIEAKKLAGRLRNLKTTEDPRVRIDMGKLGNVLAAGRPVIKGTLYSSVPPPIEPVWYKIRMQGWEVKQKRSMRTGKEKLVADVVQLVHNKENLQFGNTVIIVTGDSDVMPAIESALEMPPWKVEVRMWESGLAGDIVQASKTYPDRMAVSTLDSDIDKIAFINYCFTSKSLKHLLLQNAVVLVNPEKALDTQQWRNKMDEECGYPFQYFNASYPDNVDLHVVVVVFSMLEANGLADMLAKIRNNSALNLNSSAILTYFEMVNSKQGYPKLTSHSMENRYDRLSDTSGQLSKSGEEEGASGSDDWRILQFKEQEDDTEELVFQIVRPKKTKPKPKQLYSEQCPYRYNCKDGRDCRYAHSDAEKQFFSKRDREQSKEERTRNAQGYKTYLCNNYALARMCRYGDGCRFAHGEEDAVCLYCNDRGHLTENCPQFYYY